MKKGKTTGISADKSRITSMKTSPSRQGAREAGEPIPTQQYLINHAKKNSSY